MANNRLYIVDIESNQYLCIAKSFGNGWTPGNLDLYMEFLKKCSHDLDDKTNFIIGTESDDDFYNTFITAEGWSNFNTENKWVIPDDKVHAGELPRDLPSGSYIVHVDKADPNSKDFNCHTWVSIDDNGAMIVRATELYK